MSHRPKIKKGVEKVLTFIDYFCGGEIDGKEKSLVGDNEK